ncbi:MAG: hypothetical protein AAB609_00835 [Patescibacteria group bacterium]
MKIIKKIIKRKFLLISIFILVLALIPRSVEVLSGNYLFGFDQGQFYNDVKKIVVDHKLTLIGTQVGGIGGFFQGAGWYYLLAIPFIIFGGDPYGGMVLMLIIGIATVVSAILLTKKIFSWQEGVIIGFLIAVSPNIIAQSRFIWPPFPISLLSVFFLYFIYKILQGKKEYLGFLGLTIGLISHFEIATSGSLLFQSILFVPFLIWKKIITGRSLLRFIIGFLLPLLPLIIFDLRHEFLNTKGIMNLLFPSLNSPTANKLAESIFMNHFAIFSSSFSSMFPFIGEFWQIIALILVLGSILFIKDKNQVFEKKAFVFYLVSNPFLLFAIFMIYKDHMWTWWALQLYIFYCFLIGIILIYFFRKHLLGKITFFVIIFYFFAVYFSYTVNVYTRDYFDYGGTAKVKGKIDAIDYIYKDAKGEKFELLIFTPPIYTYPYDYLLWWHGQKKYGYIPHNEKKGVFYLLIEPDPHKPWTYEGWLETVIKTGDVVYTKTLPSGFIIQKRIEEDEKN